MLSFISNRPPAPPASLRLFSKRVRLSLAAAGSETDTWKMPAPGPAWAAVQSMAATRSCLGIPPLFPAVHVPFCREKPALPFALKRAEGRHRGCAGAVGPRASGGGLSRWRALGKNQETQVEDHRALHLTAWVRVAHGGGDSRVCFFLALFTSVPPLQNSLRKAKAGGGDAFCKPVSARTYVVLNDGCVPAPALGTSPVI